MNIPNEKHVTLALQSGQIIGLKIPQFEQAPLILMYNNEFYALKDGKYVWTLPIVCEDAL